MSQEITTTIYTIYIDDDSTLFLNIIQIILYNANIACFIYIMNLYSLNYKYLLETLVKLYNNI